METLLTAEEAAERLRVSRSQIYSMARRGSVPAVRFGDRAIRFPSDALDEWVRAQVRGGERVLVA